MKFKANTNDINTAAYYAIEFLRKAVKENKINEIENFEDIIDILDSSLSRIEYLEERLSSFNIEY